MFGRCEAKFHRSRIRSPLPGKEPTEEYPLVDYESESKAECRKPLQLPHIFPTRCGTNHTLGFRGVPDISRRELMMACCARLRELAAERRRFGCRRLGHLVARRGLKLNHKRLLRIFARKADNAPSWWPQVALGTRAPMVLPDGPSQRWSLAFVSDSLVCDRRFRMLRVSTTSRASA